MYIDLKHLNLSGEAHVYATAMGKSPRDEGDPNAVGKNLLRQIGELSEKYHTLGDNWGIIGQYMANRNRMPRNIQEWLDRGVRGLSDFEVLEVIVEQGTKILDITKSKHLPDGNIDSIRFKCWHLGYKVEFRSFRTPPQEQRKLAQIVENGVYIP